MAGPRGLLFAAGRVQAGVCSGQFKERGRVMKLRIWLFALLAMAVAPVMAQSAQQVMKQAEASMVVTGHVDIDADGSLAAHHINGRADLPDYVVELVDRAAAAWRFEPLEVDGEPVAARARMNLRLVARPVGDSEYEISIANGSFGEYSDTATDHVTRRGELTPPRYPNDMLQRSVEGTVYLVIKVGRDGSVEDVVAERVNLRAFAQEREMERMRRSFANRSINTARKWKFNPPTTGSRVDDDFWLIRIPIEYGLSDRVATGGPWEQYVPGPHNPAPQEWFKDMPGVSDSDAQVAGGIQMVGGERRLITPLEG